MRTTEIDLTQQDKNKAYFSLVKKILSEFPRLPEMYEEIAILVAYTQHYQNGRANAAISEFLGLSGQDKIYTKGDGKPAHCISQGKKGCIQIVVDAFEPLAEWKQAFVVRHEFCHLLQSSSHSSILQLLSKEYPQEWLANLVGYQRDYQVHLCMIERYLQDWLREPLGISKEVMGPRSFYRRVRKTEGVRQAILIGILNSVNVLRIIYLHEHLLTKLRIPNALREHFEQNLGRYNEYLDSWWRCLQKDIRKTLPAPRELLSRKHFEDEGAFLGQISQLLATADI
jgi:hypothetical protein